LPLGRLADDRLPFIGETHDAGRQAVAFRIGDYFGFRPFHDRNDGVGRAQIDANDFFASSHVFDTSSSSFRKFGDL
jgi:hypothetical protein